MTWRFADYEIVENACDGDPEPDGVKVYRCAEWRK